MLSKQGPARLKTAQLEAECLRLRLAGHSHRAIAAQLGVAPSTAYKRVRHALDEINKGNRETAEELRTLELTRLDALQDAIWRLAMEGDVRAINTMLHIMDRRAKLLGLDAPQRSEVVTIDAIDRRILELTQELERRGELEPDGGD